MGTEPPADRDTRPDDRASVYVAHDEGSVTTDIERPTSEVTNAGRYRLVVPLLDVEGDDTDVERLLATAATLAREHDGELIVTDVVVFPDQTPLEGARESDRTERARAEVEDLARVVERRTGVPVEGTVRLAHSETAAVLGAVEAGCDAVLLGVRNEPSQRRRLLLGDTVEKVVARADCDVFVERFETESSTGDPDSTESEIRRVLLAASGGPHSGLAAETARAIARSVGARVDVLHGVRNETSDEEHETATAVVEAAARVLDDVSGEREVIRTTDVETAIVERSADYDVTVLGADLRSAAPDEIVDAGVDLTVMGGEIVHSR